MLNNSWNYGGVLNQDGGLLIGATGGNPSVSFLASSAGTLTFSFLPGSIDIEVSPNATFFDPLVVNNGGTGQVILTISGVLIGEGSNGVNVTAAGAAGQLLVAAGAADPQFSTITSSGGTLTFFFGNNSIDIETSLILLSFFNPLQVGNGGSGQVLFTSYGVLLGEGSNHVNVAATGTIPNGQLLIASSTGDPKFVRLTTHAMLTFAFGYNTLNIEANVTGNTFFNPLAVNYGGISRSILTRFGVLIGEGSNRLNVTAAGTNGQVLIASSTGDPKFGRITSTGGSITFTVGYNSLNMDIALYSKSFFNPLALASGGTGRTILTTSGVLVGEGSGQIGAVSGTSGQLLIASSTGNPRFASVTSTGGSLTFTFGYNSLNIEPTFALSSAVNPLPLVRGATGRTILTTYGILIGEGSNSINALAAGTNGQILIASSTGDPQFASFTSTGGSITFTLGYNSLNLDVSYATNMFFNPLPASNGGTGETVLTAYGVLVGEGSNNVHAIAAGTNGQVLIASSTGDPQFARITSTGGSIIFTASYNSLNMNISFDSAAFFNPLPEVNGGTGQTILTTYGVLIGEGPNNVNVTAAGTNGQLLIASSTGDPQFFTVTSNSGSLTFSIFTSGYNSLNIDTTPLAGIPHPILAVNGATGQTLLTAYGVLVGEGSNALDITAAGTNGQVLIASSTGDPQFGAISSTGGTVTLTGGYNSINIEADFGRGPVGPLNGGTGQTILTLYGVLIGEGSNNVNVTASGTNGQVLIASSSGDPMFVTITSSGGSITFVFGYNSLNMEFVASAQVDTVGGGGTGRTILTTFGVLIGEGSNQINVTAAGTNGQLLIASSTGDPAFATISSTGGSITFVFGYNSLNIEYVPLSQVILVPYQGTGRTILTTYGVLIGEGSNNSVDVTAAGTNGQVLIASSIGDPAFATITSTSSTINFTSGYNSLNIEINPLAVVRPVSSGGTGETVLTTYGVLIGEGSNGVNVLAAGTNGQILIASSTGDPAFATITSSGGSFAFSYGYSSLNIDISAPLNINYGGTGNVILTTYGVLIGEASNSINVTNPGSNGQTLIAGTGVDPAFARITSSGGTVTFTFGYNSLNMEIIPGNQMHLVGAGGTGRTLLAAFGVLIGEGSNNVNVTAAGTSGQVLIASSTGDPKFVRMTSSGGTITFTFGPNSLNAEAVVTSRIDGVLGGGTGRTILTTFGVLLGEGSNSVNVTAAGTSGQVLIASSTGDPAFARITSVGGNLTFRVGPGSLNVDVNGILDISLGCTKRAILTTYGVLIGEGSLAVNVTAPGTNGKLLVASSTGDPAFSMITSSGGTITFTVGYNSLNLEIAIGSQVDPVPGGGTGGAVLTAYGVLIGEGSNPVNVVVGTNGQVLISSSTGDPKFGRITSTGNTLSFSFGYNSLNVDVSGMIDISFGALKRSILTAYGVLIGEGSMAVNVAVGTSGQVLISSSTGDPQFARITSSGGSITFSFGYNSLNMDIVPGARFHSVAVGGTDRTILTAYGVLIGEGSNPVNVAVGTNGQVLISSSTGDPKFVRITSTGNTLSFSFGYNSLNVDVSGMIDISFGALKRSILTAYGVLIGEGSMAVNVAVGTSGQVLISSSTGDPQFARITSSGGSITFSFGYNSLNMDIVPGARLRSVTVGGTGRTILTTYGVLLGEGSNQIRVTAAGLNGQVLIAAAGADPKFATITSTGNTLTFTFGPNSLNIDTTAAFAYTYVNPWPTINGGTGQTVLTLRGVLLGEGSLAVGVTAAGTDGQLFIGSTNSDPQFASLTSSGASIAVSSGASSLNIDVAGAVNINFGGTDRTILTTYGVLIGEGSSNIHVTAAGTNGQLLIAGVGVDPAFSTLSSSRGTFAFTAGLNSLNLDLNILLSVGAGGTGRSVLTTYGVLVGEGSKSVNVTAAGTNGQLLLAAAGADPKFSTVTSTGGTITFTKGAGSLNVEFGATFSRANTFYVVNSVTGITSSAVTASISTSFNYYLIDTTNGTVTLQFPASPITGRSWIVKDHGGMSDLNPIRITTSGGTLNFDGQTFFNLTNPFGSVHIMYNGNAPAHYEII